MCESWTEHFKKLWQDGVVTFYPSSASVQMQLSPQKLYYVLLSTLLMKLSIFLKSRGFKGGRMAVICPVRLDRSLFPIISVLPFGIFSLWYF